MTQSLKSPKIQHNTQIKVKDIPNYRAMISRNQKYKCAICKVSLGGVVATLDHCHSSGLLRGVLCSPCNKAEGKVKAGAQYMQKVTHMTKKDYIRFLMELVKYLIFHDENPGNIIHPTYDVSLGRQKPRKRRKKSVK